MMKILLALVLLVGSAHAQTIVAPTVYWPMNEGTGTAVNSAIGSFNCSFTNTPTWVRGFNDWSLDFSGTTQFLACGTSHAVATNDWSVSAWIKLDATATTRVIVISGDVVTSGGRSGFQFDVSDTDTLRCIVESGAGVQDAIVSTGTIPETGIYTHVGCIKSGTSVKTYINGVNDGSATLASATMDYTADAIQLRIASTTGGGSYFDGIIDEVKIWNSAIGEDQMKWEAKNPYRNRGLIQ